MTALLDLRNVSKRFSKPQDIAVRLARRLGARIPDETVHAVDDVSIQVGPGEVVGLVGESGCGKSTLGRVAAGIHAPSAGEILWRGVPVTASREARLRVQMVFQDPMSSLNPRHRIDRILTEAPRVHGQIAARDADAFAAEMLEKVGLDASFRTRYPHQFSGGQRQRIAIARAGGEPRPDRRRRIRQRARRLGAGSGATMERPALKMLLRDIKEHRVDVVVVYKIDCLTRSLTDFARIVEIFDGANASFVSVTQQFNTTTSMGRLTLNVLLSFAQFEREVIAERIRDKIAASKQKGMWMGGGVPLGYRAQNRKLVIDEGEAAIVRYLFARYLELRSVRALATEATAKSFPARFRVRTGSSDDGGMVTRPTDVVRPGTRRFGRGQLYHILSNPIYVGKVRHREKIHEGQHDAIIDEQIFAAAQSSLAFQAPRRTNSSNAADLHLLTGILFDEEGHLLRPVHTRKGNVRYRYYVSRARVEERGTRSSGWRLPARALEQPVEAQLDHLLSDGKRLGAALQTLLTIDDLPRALDSAKAFKVSYRNWPPQRRREIIRRLIWRIELMPALLIVKLDLISVAEELTGNRNAVPDNADQARILDLNCTFTLRRRGFETKLILTDRSVSIRDPDEGLIRLLVRARDALAQLTDGTGRGIGELAAASGLDRSDFSRLLRVAFLAPDLVDCILNGTQSVELTSQKLARLPDLPLSWKKQRALFDGEANQ